MLSDWLGYLEHATPRALNVFDANTGKGGYTIFAEIVRERWGVDFQGLPWCVTFLFAAHPAPDRMGAPCVGVRTLMRRMMRIGLWRGRRYAPKPGDIIFLKNAWSMRTGHCGIVEAADDETVTSIDGNTVDPSGVFDRLDGGAVARRTRKRNDKRIVGYAAVGWEEDHGTSGDHMRRKQTVGGSARDGGRKGTYRGPDRCGEVL